MQNKVKEPKYHIVKRDTISWKKAMLIRMSAIVIALVVCAVLTAIVTKDNPVSVFVAIIKGAFGSNRKFMITMQDTSILLIISLALTPAFMMRFWNIGGEGQVLMGALGASISMICFAPYMPHVPLVIVTIIMSIVFGAVWGFIPALFKALWNTNETLSTLMMNYIATQLVAYFCVVKGVPKGTGNIGIINQSTGKGWLPDLFGSKQLLAIVVALLITAVMYIYLNYSKQGYEIRVVGESERTAKYVGMNVKKIIIRTMVISGALCGVAGLILVGSVNHSLTTTISNGQGFTAVMVSWLAKFNPFTMIFASMLIVVLDKGASQIATSCQLNESFADILTGIILFFIIGCEFFISYKIAKKNKNEEVNE